MSRVRVWYDPDPDQIFISSETRSFARRSLVAGISGNLIMISLKGATAGTYVAGGQWSDFGDQDGNPFQSPEAVKAYLDGIFAMRRTPALEFTQSQPSSFWTIPHNLGFRPGVSLVDTAGDPMTADWRYPDANTVTVTFNVPTSGTAYLS